MTDLVPDLYDIVLSAMPDMERERNVPDWPEDERDLHRNGFPEHWQDFASQHDAVTALIRRKAARAIADAVNTQTADLGRQLEQARSIAVQLEQQLAAVLTVTAELVVDDDGRVWWVSPGTGARVTLGPGSVLAYLAMVTTAAEVISAEALARLAEAVTRG